MRKGYWYAALLGAVSLTFGNAGLGPWCDGPTRSVYGAEGSGSVQYFSRSGKTSAQAYPAEREIPFQRMSDLRTARDQQPAGPAVDNYYKELFGAQPAATGAASPKSVAPVVPKPTGLQLGNDVNDAPSSVVQAGYESTATPGQPAIQQVAAKSPATAPVRKPVIRTEAAAAPATGESPTVSVSDVGVQKAALKVEWEKLGAIVVGEECKIQLIVSNNGASTAHDVSVDAFFPTSVRLTAAEPKPTVDGSRLTWTLGDVATGAERKIELSLIPSTRGELTTSAVVRSTTKAAAKFQVEEPLLQVVIQGPSEVMIGDPASQLVTVTNPGTGTAENVRIEAVIPAGLEHLRGERLIMDVGSLNAGESRTVRLALAAVTGGAHVVSVEARNDEGLRDAAAVRVNVLAPSLKVALDGPGLRYKGRQANYDVTVTNDGSVATNNVRASQKVAPGFTFVSADHGGQWDPATRTVQWFVGRLEAGQSTTLKVDLTADTLGSHLHVVQAVSEHGLKSVARTETKVEGAASLVLDVIDLDDPVEVGIETAYEVTVRNDGTLAAANVGVTCQLPPGLTLSRVASAVPHLVENDLLAFKPVASLAPGKSVKYQIFVTGAVAGNYRFKAQLTSDAIQDPLVSEQLTKFYGE